MNLGIKLIPYLRKKKQVSTKQSAASLLLQMLIKKMKDIFWDKDKVIMTFQGKHTRDIIKLNQPNISNTSACIAQRDMKRPKVWEDIWVNPIHKWANYFKKD